MKALFRFLLVGALGMFVVAGLVWMYAKPHAVRIFNESMSAWTGQDVAIRSIYPAFPSSLVVRGLDIRGWITADKVRAEIDWPRLFRRELRARMIRISDVLILQGAPEEKAVPAALSVSLGEETSSLKMNGWRIFVRQVLVENGTLRIRTSSGEELRAENIEAYGVSVWGDGKPERMDFSVTAMWFQPRMFSSGCSVAFSGWLDWEKRDMDARGEAQSQDGLIRMTVRALSTRNNLSINGNIVLRGQGADPDLPGSFGVMENVVRDVLTATETDIDADFSFETRLDRFELGPIAFKGNMTTGLNSSATSGTIVQSLRAFGEQLLKEDPDVAEILLDPVSRSVE